MRDDRYGEPNSPATGASGRVFSGTVQITFHTGEAHFYTVSEEQLNNLSSGTWQIYTSLACTFFGFFGSLLSVFLAGFSSPSPIHTTITVAAAMTSGILFAFFGVMAFFAHRTHARDIALIKERRYQT